MWDKDSNKAKTEQNWVTLTQQGNSKIWNVVAAGENGASLDSADEAKAFAEWLNTNKGSNTGTEFKSSNGTAKAESLAPGYYLITSSLGNQLILATSDVEVYEKNNYPGSDKTQSTEQNGTYADTDVNREIGQTVYYHVDVTIPATAKDTTKTITVTDTTTKGLTLNNTGDAITWSATTKTGTGDPDPVTTTEITGWDSLPKTWTAGTTDTDGNTTYTVIIPASVVSKLAESANDTTTVTLTLAYSANVNADAVIYDGSTGTNNNSAHISYDNFTTTDETVKTRVFDFKLKKEFRANNSDSTNSTDNTLSATFELRTDADTASTAKKFTSSGAGDNMVYTLAPTESGDDAKKITVTNTQTVTIKGLASGTYYLVETDTAAGYNKLTKSIKVEIDADGKVKFTDNNVASPTATSAELHATADVINKPGSTLPSTGGIGTTIFYVAGGILIVGAAALLISRKRKEA